MSGRAVLATLLLGLGVNSARAQEVGTSTTTTETPPPPPALEVEPPPAALEPPGVVVETPPAEETTAVETETKKEEELIVTGSRIRRLDLVTPAPVSVLTKTELQESGLGSIGQILQNLPSQSNAINIQTNNGGDGSTRINLRGIGTERTLVLLNGRRFVPGGTGADASVDLNAIPVSIIERVEVLKDGASAVFGSDAVAGVVNIITKKDFSGVEGTTYIGSGQVGGFVYDLSVTAGHTTEKGNILFSFSLFDQNDIFAAERPFSNPDTAFNYEADLDMDMMPDCAPNCGKDTEGRLQTLGSSAIPQTYLSPVHADPDLAGVGNAAWEALFGSATGPYIKDPVTGDWRKYANTGVMSAGEGDQYNYQPENYLVTPQSRYSLFATGSYDVFDYVSVYGEASYTNRQSDQLLAPEPFFSGQEGIVVSADNVYNPFGRDFFDVRRRFTEAGPRRFIEDIDTYRAVIGVNGGLPGGLGFLSDWRWDSNFNYGRTEGTTIKEGLLVRPRLSNALGPSFINDAGVATCGTPDAPIDACVPLDLFGGEGAITPEMLRYLTYTGTARGFSQQQVFEAGISGPLFPLFDREIGLALGYQFRDESGGFQPDPITQSGDTTGNKGEATLGGYAVNSVYGELNIPLHFDIPFIETFELNGALSFVSIKADETPLALDPEAASEVTWKTGARWQLFDQVALRGSASRSFRNPSVGELFAGQADSFPQAEDPCNTIDSGTGMPRQLTANQVANCGREGVPTDLQDDRAQLRSRVGGSPDVQPETADVFTAGVVFTPNFGPFLSGLSVTVDYWNIDVQNAIQPAGEVVLLANCYSVDPALSAGCDKISRNAQGMVDNIFDTETNIGGVETGGIDIGLVYRLETDVGNFRYSFDATWLQKYNEILPSPFNPDGVLAEGKGTYDLGVYPDWRFNTTLVYGIAGFHIGANLRFVNSYKECAGGLCRLDQNGDGQPDVDDDGIAIVPLSRQVSSYVNADVFAGYQFAWDAGLTDVSVGINNLSDTLPPYIDNGFTANSDETAYDFIGRYFYARLAHTF